jgi:hypothetical protein
MNDGLREAVDEVLDAFYESGDRDPLILSDRLAEAVRAWLALPSSEEEIAAVALSLRVAQGLSAGYARLPRCVNATKKWRSPRSSRLARCWFVLPRRQRERVDTPSEDGDGRRGHQVRPCHLQMPLRAVARAVFRAALALSRRGSSSE